MSLAVQECSPQDARLLTDRIKTAVGMTWELIIEAYETRAWAALGYGSWDDYRSAEFGACRLRLPREERQEVVGSLREAGLSLRAIASVTGISHVQVRNELEAGVQNLTPESSSVIARDLELGEDDGFDLPVDHEQLPRWKTPPPTDVDPPKIKGRDGKNYSPRASKPPTQKEEPRADHRRPLRDDFTSAVLDLGRVTERIGRLVGDDRFARNSDQIAQLHLSDLIRAKDSLERVITQMPKQGA